MQDQSERSHHNRDRSEEQKCQFLQSAFLQTCNPLWYLMQQILNPAYHTHPRPEVELSRPCFSHILIPDNISCCMGMYLDMAHISHSNPVHSPEYSIDVPIHLYLTSGRNDDTHSSTRRNLRASLTTARLSTISGTLH